MLKSDLYSYIKISLSDIILNKSIIFKGSYLQPLLYNKSLLFSFLFRNNIFKYYVNLLYIFGCMVASRRFFFQQFYGLF